MGWFTRDYYKHQRSIGRITFGCYRGLWKIEEAFVNKHTLKMRPIYQKKSRIETHIAICFLAYSLSYTMKHQLEKAGMKFSIHQMRQTLKRDQYSIIEDQRSKKLYRFPSKLTQPIRAIYQAFGLKKSRRLLYLNFLKMCEPITKDSQRG